MMEDTETRLYETAQMALGVLVETADDPAKVANADGTMVTHEARAAARSQAMAFLACYLSRASAPLLAAMNAVPSPP